MLTITDSEIELVHSLFAKITPITIEETQEIANYLKKESYLKDDTILDIGQIDSRISFVIKGVVHMFTYIDGEVFTINISLPGMVYNSLDSYIYNQPSNEIQVAVSDVEILYLNKNNAEELMLNNKHFCYIYAKLYEFVLSEREQRTLILQYKSANKRFEEFLQKISNAQYYLQEVPQKLIAQYLGIAPETFCRAKNQYLKQNNNCNEQN